VQIKLAPPNLVTIYSKLVYRGQPAQVQLSGTVAADPAGGPQFTPQSVIVDGLPVPLSAAQATVNKVSASLTGQAKPALPMKLDSVIVQGSELVITGRRK